MHAVSARSRGVYHPSKLLPMQLLRRLTAGDLGVPDVARPLEPPLIAVVFGAGVRPAARRVISVRAMSSAEPKKVVIVGGVAGGASCAARLRRLTETTQITILERGPYVSFANVSIAGAQLKRASQVAFGTA